MTRFLPPHIALLAVILTAGGCALPQAPIVVPGDAESEDTNDSTDSPGDEDGASAPAVNEVCTTNSDCEVLLAPLPTCATALCNYEVDEQGGRLDGTSSCTTGESPGGTSCDDGNTCTQNDVCLAGECLPGAALNCADTNPCTDDSCDSVSGCANVFNESPCDDGDACTTGDLCGEGDCISGSPTECDDENTCTTNECDQLLGCLYPPVPGEQCNDEDACTVGDQCDATGACQALGPLDCNDDNPCTTDTCSATLGCVWEPNTAPCDDGEICTIDDACTEGLCTGQDDLCDDSDPCTVDSCDDDSGCSHLTYQGACNDGNPCTLNDVCIDGICTGSENLCDDSNLCTLDFCHPISGCQATPLLGAQCDDSNACTNIDSCSAQGGCLPGLQLDCDDDKICTTDSCDPIEGCVHVELDAGCDDGDSCTMNDVCVEGICVGEQLACIDDNFCTSDTCEQSQGCVFAFNTTSCDDEDPCTVNDTCVEGSCVGLTGSCDDDNPCTIDSCDESALCQNIVITGACDDGNACTVGDSCIDAACVPGPEAACDDSDDCTIDLCSPTSGCSHSTVPSCLPPAAWPIINEFDYEQHGTDTADFIELVVVGEQTVELDAYVLELVDGTTGQPYDTINLSIASDQLHPGERLVIGPSSVIASLAGKVATLVTTGDFLENGGVDGDAIRLIRQTPAGDETVDSVAYEHPVPGANEGDSHVGFDSQFTVSASSFSRCADSQDTDTNSFDFLLGAPSPGDTNPCEVETE